MQNSNVQLGLKLILLFMPGFVMITRRIHKLRCSQYYSDRGAYWTASYTSDWPQQCHCCEDFDAFNMLLSSTLWFCFNEDFDWRCSCDPVDLVFVGCFLARQYEHRDCCHSPLNVVSVNAHKLTISSCCPAMIGVATTLPVFMKGSLTIFHPKLLPATLLSQ